MKTLRKNVDLPSETVAVLQIEATLKGFGSLKPFLESILKDFATKSARSKPKVYEAIVVTKVQKIEKKGIRKRA
jgi:hypothetical protein